MVESALQSERFFRHMSDRYYELRDAVANGEAFEMDHAKLYEDLAALALFAADWFKTNREQTPKRQ